MAVLAAPLIHESVSGYLRGGGTSPGIGQKMMIASMISGKVCFGSLGETFVFMHLRISSHCYLVLIVSLSEGFRTHAGHKMMF